MTIRFYCPLGHKLAVPDELAGKKGRCPECNQRVYIPRPDSPENAAAPPPGGIPEAIVHPDALQLEGEEDLLSALEGGSAGPGGIQPWEAAGEAPLAALPGTSSGESPSGVATDPDPNSPPRAAPPALPGESLLAAEDADAPLPPPAFPEAEIDEETDGYQPDPGKVQTVYMLAVALGALAVLGAAPGLRHLNLLDAPGWAQVVLLMSALQLIYVFWIVSLPDWSTVWIGMVVYAVSAAVYGVGWAVVSFTPAENPVNFLHLDQPGVRERAGGWCLTLLLLTTLMVYACGRLSGKWRKAFEIAKRKNEIGENPKS